MSYKIYGKCAICGNEAKLSKDHIPPKCCGNIDDSYYIQYTPDFLGETKKPIHSQGGLTFYHICEKCNNDMGTKYDTQLQIFRDCVLSLINRQPFSMAFDLEKVCKSIVGHFLAAASYDTCIFARAMRDFYIHNNKTILRDYTLICAYYPFENTIFSFNDYAPIGKDNIPKGMISSLYFYPFAFIFCEKQVPTFGTDLFELCRNKCLALKLSSEDWKGRSPNWPAIVDDEHAFIAGATMNDSKYKF